MPGSGGSGSAGESAWGPGKRSGSSAEDSRERAGERSGASLIMMDWQGERVGIRERERERDLGEMDRAGRERERRENGGRKSSGTSGSAAIGAFLSLILISSFEFLCGPSCRLIPSTRSTIYIHYHIPVSHPTHIHLMS